LPQLLVGRLLEDYRARYQRFADAQVPDGIANYAAVANLLYACLGIIDAAASINAPVQKVAEVYFAIAQELELDLFAKQIAELKVENHWQSQQREAFRDDLEWQMRKLAVGAMRHMCEKGDVETCISRWLQQQHALVERWRALLLEVQGTEAKEFALYGVAIRELLDLAQRSQHDEAG